MTNANDQEAVDVILTEDDWHAFNIALSDH